MRHRTPRLPYFPSCRVLRLTLRHTYSDLQSARCIACNIGHSCPASICTEHNGQLAYAHPLPSEFIHDQPVLSSSLCACYRYPNLSAALRRSPPR